MVAICRLIEPELAAMTHSCKPRSSSHRQGQQMGLFEKAQGGMYRALLDIIRAWGFSVGKDERGAFITWTSQPTRPLLITVAAASDEGRQMR